jgi:hypothetical protein
MISHSDISEPGFRDGHWLTAEACVVRWAGTNDCLFSGRELGKSMFSRCAFR